MADRRNTIALAPSLEAPFLNNGLYKCLIAHLNTFGQYIYYFSVSEIHTYAREDSNSSKTAPSW